MRIYISLPISGFNIEHCRERAQMGVEMVERRGHVAVNPFDVCPEQDLTYAQYLGKDIEALLGCDGIFLMTGWSSSPGCNAEWRVAEVYRKKIFHHISEIPYEAR